MITKKGMDPYDQIWYIQSQVERELKPIPLVFWRSAAGNEPAREWLNELPRPDRRAIGHDIARVQYGWPIGLPVCRSLRGGIWEVRSSLPSRREGRVLFGFHDGVLVAVTAFIKKTRTKPNDENADYGRSRMTIETNPHLGSNFTSWLDEQGFREEVTAAAIKSVLAEQLHAAMKEKGLTKARMAELMQTSRSQVDRLLNPKNGSATLETLLRAAKIVGRELRVELY